MKAKLLIVLLAAALLCTGCGKTAQSGSTSASPTATATLVTPTPARTVKPQTTPTPTPAPTGSPSPSPSATPKTTEAPPSADGWVGSYAKDAGSAGQVTMTVTAGSKSGAFHFVLDAKGLTAEGDAVIDANGRSAVCKEQGNLSFALGGGGITVTEGTSINDNVAFSGFYQLADGR
ncbi:MAG: hypothetical protein PHG73_13675 [Pygmaiobacter sp.]|nr:hypothetical protein [Pygmaiobacter sp.]